MKHTNKITNEKWLITVVLGFVLCSGVTIPEAWAGLDAYVIYAGKNRKETEAFLKNLPKDLSVKTYNSDLLAVADYSGKQKALTKLERASVIVMFSDEPLKLLRGAMLKSNLVIVQSVLAEVRSGARRLYVLSKGTDYSKLANVDKTLDATKPETLNNSENLEGIDIILVDDKKLDIFLAASLVTRTVLDMD